MLIRQTTYLGDTDDGVLDDRLEGIHRASLFVTSVPHLNSNDEVLVGGFTSGHFHDSDVYW